MTTKGYFIVGYMLWTPTKKERKKLRRLAFHKTKKAAEEHLRLFCNDKEKYYDLWIEKGELEDVDNQPNAGNS